MRGDCENVGEIVSYGQLMEGLTSLVQAPAYVLSLVVMGLGLFVLLLRYLFVRYKMDKSPERVAEFSQSFLDQRQLLLRRLEDDEWGARSETIRQLLNRKFGSGPYFWGGGLRIGLENVMRRAAASSGNEDGVPFDVTLSGKVKGRHLEIHFIPPFPVFLSLAATGLSLEELYKAGDKPGTDRSALPIYECFDFPLPSLQGLTAELPGLQKDLLCVAVNGVLARGFGLSGQLLSTAQLRKMALSFEAALGGLKLTQPRLYQEVTVVTAWSYLILGLQKREASCLMKALKLYQGLEKDKSAEFDSEVRAGVKANEAMAAFALSQLQTGFFSLKRESSFSKLPRAETDFITLNENLFTASQEALRFFRRETYPVIWGKLMTMMGAACAGLGMKRGQAEFIENAGGLGQGGCFHNIRTTEAQLSEVIEYWRENHQPILIASAEFIKGLLAKNKAQQQVGLQDWERAENAFLGALAKAPETTNWWLWRRVDIQYELGMLYLEWGTDFGEKGLLEKAIHYFEGLPTGALSPLPRRVIETALARCHLNLGGVTNDVADHRKALALFTALFETGARRADRQEVVRALSVVRARLALVEQNVKEARLAVSEISSVLGHNHADYPPRDVLLRLRARLREMIFLLEGDDISLDRAIQDRRALVAIADDSVSELRWAVEVRDLAGLLSRRQFQAPGRPRDFHEAHYLLEQCLAICEASEIDTDAGAVFTVSYIKATLYFQLGRLLSSFARIQNDQAALEEAITAYQGFLELTPRTLNGPGRADALHHLGQIHMDLSSHYGQHEGLGTARALFAEAFDIYLELGFMDQANRMRRFMENAAAALVAYQSPDLSGRSQISG